MSENILEKEILNYFYSNKEEFVNYLVDLVKLESPSLEADSQQAVFDYIRSTLVGMGYSTKIIPGTQYGGVLVASPGKRSEGRIQLLLGHVDTVWPMGTLSTMPVNITDDKITGPGIFDMKGGITQAIFALKALQELSMTPPVEPVLLLTSDEETGSFESQDVIENYARKADRVLVLEPALGEEGRLKTSRKGFGDFEFTIRGKASHAGLAPEDGVSAIMELSYVIQKLHALNDPDNGVTVNVGTVSGGLRPNVIAPESHAAVDVRVLTNADGERVKKAIYDIKPETKGIEIKISGGMNRGPLEKTARNQKLWEIAKITGARLGLNLGEGSSGGASDGNITTRYAPTLDGLGPVGNGAHAHNEHIIIDKTLERGALLACLILHEPITS